MESDTEGAGEGYGHSVDGDGLYGGDEGKAVSAVSEGVGVGTAVRVGGVVSGYIAVGVHGVRVADEDEGKNVGPVMIGL